MVRCEFMMSFELWKVKVETLNTEVAPFILEVEPLSLNVAPLRSEVAPLNLNIAAFILEVAPLNLNIAAFILEIAPLSLNVAVLMSEVTLLSLIFNRRKAEGIGQKVERKKKCLTMLGSSPNPHGLLVPPSASCLLPSAFCLTLD